MISYGNRSFFVIIPVLKSAFELAGGLSFEAFYLYLRVKFLRGATLLLLFLAPAIQFARMPR